MEDCFMSVHPPVPCLWFNTNGEEAAKFYVDLLGGEIGRVSRYGPDMHVPEGTAMLIEFTLRGAHYQALNGGPTYALTPAISLSVACDTQDEIDRLWDALLADGGVESRCGWLSDRFGLSWQIFPSMMPEILTGPDKEGAARAMQAMMGMVKLDLAALKAAFEGKTN
jgi:predicted 3-demethylubiquinone-9 3-methyltransferase (glyoxalase superfamily)